MLKLDRSNFQTTTQSNAIHTLGLEVKVSYQPNVNFVEFIRLYYNDNQICVNGSNTQSEWDIAFISMFCPFNEQRDVGCILYIIILCIFGV